MKYPIRLLVFLLPVVVTAAPADTAALSADIARMACSATTLVEWFVKYL